MKTNPLDSCIDMICNHMICAIAAPEGSVIWKWRWSLVETWLIAAERIIQAE